MSFESFDLQAPPNLRKNPLPSLLWQKHPAARARVFQCIPSPPQLSLWACEGNHATHAMFRTHANFKPTHPTPWLHISTSPQNKISQTCFSIWRASGSNQCPTGLGNPTAVSFSTSAPVIPTAASEQVATNSSESVGGREVCSRWRWYSKRRSCPITKKNAK